MQKISILRVQRGRNLFNESPFLALIPHQSLHSLKALALSMASTSHESLVDKVHALSLVISQELHEGNSNGCSHVAGSAESQSRVGPTSSSQRRGRFTYRPFSLCGQRRNGQIHIASGAKVGFINLLAGEIYESAPLLGMIRLGHC